MHVANTERIITQILRQPERFNMAQWVRAVYDSETHDVDVCGTACCIAGWAVVNDIADQRGHDKAIRNVIHKHESIDWIDEGTLLLELPDAGKREGPDLFYVADWPWHYRDIADSFYDDDDLPDHDWAFYRNHGVAIAGAQLLRDMLDGVVRIDDDNTWWSHFAHNLQEA